MRIEMLPAAFGDCLLVSYEDGVTTRRVLIDAGLTKTYKEVLAPRLLAEGKRVELELLVVTHIDRDHICGILPLLRANPRLISAKDIWFNGYDHLTDVLGPKDGEALGELLESEGLPWNQAFKKKPGDKVGGAVVVPDAGPLPVVHLAGGARLTLLSPRRAKLRKLLEFWNDDKLGTWDDEVGAGAGTGVAPAPAEPDDVLGKRPAITGITSAEVDAYASERCAEDKTAPNGSSIAFLFEHGDARVLFAADAHPSELLDALERYAPGERVALSAFKLSHHGSENNLSEKLLEKIDCPRYLVSTNGDSFGHPHAQAISRVITLGGAKKTIYFNYACAYTTAWNDRTVLGQYGCDVVYPEDEAAGAVIDL